MNSDYPTFAEAKARLQNLLRDLGHSNEILWVFPEDLILSRQIFVRSFNAAAAEQRAQAEYRLAAQRRLGVALDAIGSAGDFVLAQVFRPADADQAERFLMPDGLKLSVSKPLREGVLVRGRIAWWWRSLITTSSRSSAENLLGLEREKAGAA